jgi:acetoin utilization protein AcuB
MRIKDIMTWNVVTVSSDTPIMEARRMMETHRVRRLPVVDRGKLVGIVTLDRIIGAGPSPTTTLSVWEINYLIAKMTVKELMQKEVVTIGPDASIEQGLVLAQGKHVGIMPVVEKGTIIGVVTTTDFALKVLNPTLGVHMKGVKLEITPCSQPGEICDVMGILKGQGAKLVTGHSLQASDDAPAGFAVLVDTSDASKLIKELEGKGFKVHTEEM